MWRLFGLLTAARLFFLVTWTRVWHWGPFQLSMATDSAVALRSTHCFSFGLWTLNVSLWTFSNCLIMLSDWGCGDGLKTLSFIQYIYKSINCDIFILAAQERTQGPFSGTATRNAIPGQPVRAGSHIYTKKRREKAMAVLQIGQTPRQ